MQATWAEISWSGGCQHRNNQETHQRKFRDINALMLAGSLYVAFVHLDPGGPKSVYLHSLNGVSIVILR